MNWVKYFFFLLGLSFYVESTASNILFRLDMNNNDGFTTPEVNGTFNNWCGNCAPMTDDNGDGIWELTISLENGSYEYKFSNDNWSGQEILTSGSSCTVTNGEFTNRILNVSGDATLPIVCWATCAACQNITTYMVTFRVDMSYVTSPFDTPEVNGTFNNWCGNCFTMSDANEDNIWEASIQLASGDYQYKFSYDAWSGQEELMSGSACTVTVGEFVNRTLSVSSDMLLPVVCWETCAACVIPVEVEVIFNLDASQMQPTGAEISGNFNGFCNACEPMVSLGNGMWTDTLMLFPGVYEYYYTLNQGAMQESLVKGNCTVSEDGEIHRIFSHIEATDLPMVCWESCQSCGVFVEENSDRAFSLYPNPASEYLNISMQNPENGVTRLFSISGVLVKEKKFVNQSKVQLSTQDISGGVYELLVVTEGWTEVRTVIIEN